MMNYEEFKEKLTERLPGFLPEEYEGCQIKVSKGYKTNRTLDFIELLAGKEKFLEVIPRFNAQELYSDYKRHGNFEQIIQIMYEEMQYCLIKGLEISSMMKTENMSEKIIYSLINYEQNREMLEDVPHRKWHDLAVIYRLIVSRQEGHSCLVGNRLMEVLGMDEAGLYQTAAVNTLRLYPPEVKGMPEVLKEIMGNVEAPGMPGSTDAPEDGFPEAGAMYVLSNDERSFGSASVLYTDIIENLAAAAGDDLYLLPSSVHEWIAVPAAAGRLDELAEMVSEINYNEVCLEEQLSNQVYFYRKGSMEVTMATDLPFRRFTSINES